MSNQSLCSTTSVDSQQCALPNYFAEADELLAAAIQCIEEGRSNGSAGAVETCNLLVILLHEARVPLRRLGGDRAKESYGVD